MKIFAMVAISGITGVFHSYPIDTIKTNIQKHGVIHRQQLNTVAKLYRGIWSPLLGVGFEKAIVFGMYEKTQRVFENPDRSIPLVNAISGGVAGLSASFLVTPYERIKILLQNGDTIRRQTFQLRSLFRGLSMTFTREVPGFAIYFSVYEGLKYHLHTKRNTEIGQLRGQSPLADAYRQSPYGHLNSFIYGGASGAAAWIFIYPQDRIKTIIQSCNADIQSNQTNTVSYYWNHIRKTGGFYKGFRWALYRAVLLHSGTFAMMEFLSGHIAFLDEFSGL